MLKGSSSKSVMVRGEASAAQVWVPKGIVASVPLVAQPEATPLESETTIALTQVTAATDPAVVPLTPTQEPDPELLDQARAEAYALGFADGKRQSEQAHQAERDAFAAMLISLDKARQELQTHLAEEVLSLGLDLAKLIMRQALALNPEAVLPVLREAMTALPGLAPQAVLHLHPEDAALVRPLLTQDPTMALTAWTIAEDARIERGGCRLETAQSEVDATLPMRWSRVVAAVGREDSWRTDSKKS